MESRKAKRGFVSGKAIRFACAILSTCFLTTIFLAVHRLPELPYGYKEPRAHSSTRSSVIPENQPLHKLGEMMIAMLPQDLAFTVFVPSARAFRRDLRLDPNVSLSSDKVNDTYAVITRILAFSAVPRLIPSNAVTYGDELSYDSLSGFTLYILKDGDKKMVVNGVQSERLDERRGEVLVHVIDGVLMDVQFRQSVQPDDND
ncbi:hypothetical protein MLD38_038694 [Melastoma candidum]|uniref:Uncharacterized protein n=1 Tax=Melastoma candidum TaxID=119954 RepID=A0ACB9L210_9MYRT|nr:hypothetical protein MLD38_038694 [Melastoma candidum]